MLVISNKANLYSSIVQAYLILKQPVDNHEQNTFNSMLFCFLFLEMSIQYYIYTSIPELMQKKMQPQPILHKPNTILAESSYPCDLSWN
jgi:hypothetical protein